MTASVIKYGCELKGIVTGEENCDIQTDSGCIHVVPAWDFLLFR